MNVFLLPNKLCKEMDSIMSKFWWNHKQKERGIHWRKWKLLGESKACGELGFKNLEAFNKVMLAKQLRRVIKQPDSLVSQILKHKYFRNGRILKAKVGLRSSILWRSIISSLSLLKEGLYWRLGMGKATSIWKDNWILTPTSFSIQSPIQALDKEAHFSALIDALWGLELRDSAPDFQ